MKKLTRDDLKKVMGGGNTPAAGICSGLCIGSVGEWTYAPENGSLAGCLQDIQTYCRSGSGTCNTCATGGGGFPII